MKDSRANGFTLIEMSIVLVVIGLIIGAVLIGADLIKSTQLMRIGRDKERLVAAVQTFRTKYNCLPGDCPNATSFFIAGNCNGSIETATAVCNGDGDGVIGSDANYFYQWENFYFWRMLNAAGLIAFTIPGSNYTMPQTTWMGVLDNSSAPQGSYPSSIMYITNTYVVNTIDSGTAWAGGSKYMPADYTNALTYAVAGSTGFNSDGALLTPAQAQQVDNKFDDGYSNTGAIIAGGYPYDPCADPPSSAPYPYTPVTPTSNPTCGLIFLRPF